MARTKTIYRCTSCGHQSAKWLGRCPGCTEWNTLHEETSTPANAKGTNDKRSFRLPDAAAGPRAVPEGQKVAPSPAAHRPVALSLLIGGAAERTPTGMRELD